MDIGAVEKLVRSISSAKYDIDELTRAKTGISDADTYHLCMRSDYFRVNVQADVMIKCLDDDIAAKHAEVAALEQSLVEMVNGL